MENKVITTTAEAMQEAVNRKAEQIAEAKIAEFRKAQIPAAEPQSKVLRINADYTVMQDKAEIMNKYFRAVLNRDTGAMREISTQANQKFGTTRANFTVADSGAPVPQFWQDEVYSAVDKLGYARNLFKIVPMRGGTEKLTAGAAATAGVVAEGTAVTVTDSASFYTSTNLVAKEIAGAAILSRAWLEDSNPSAYQFITDEIANRIAYTEDIQAINGNGSGANFTGLLGTSGVVVSRLAAAGSAGFGGISWVDLNTARLSLNPQLQRNGMFLVPQSVFGFLVNEKDTTGRPIWQQSAPITYEIGLVNLQADVYLSPTGRPLVVVPDAFFPTTGLDRSCAIFGDFSRFAVMGVRSELDVREHTDYLTTDLAGTRQVGISVAERVAFAFPAPSAFAVLKTKAS